MRARFLTFGALAACLGPTEITVDITTNVPCSALDSVDIVIGNPGELETRAITTSTKACDAEGHVGSMVILPGSTGAVAFSVFGGVGTSTDACRAQGYKSCIVARRELEFIPHQPLTLPIELDERCIDQACPSTDAGVSTCVNGACVPAVTCASPDGCGDAGASKVITPVAIGSAGASLYATGYGQQIHVIEALQDGRTWVFYVDGTSGSGIRSRVSSDFSTWSDSDGIPLSSFALADGYTFSVAYGVVGGIDVLHIIANVTDKTGQTYSTAHVRATITGGHIPVTQLYLLPNTSNGGSCTTDGPSSVIGPDGHVYDVTAWTAKGGTTCDTNVYRSDNVDTGSGFAEAFTQIGYFVSVPTFAFAHQLLSLPQAKLVLATYPDNDNAAPFQDATIFRGLGWALSNAFGDADGGVVQQADTEVFYNGNTQASYDDWDVCRLTDTDIHAVRHVLTTMTTTGPFEEARFDGTKWSLTPQSPASVTGATNTGVVLLSDANPNDGMLLATIASDNSIHVSKWTTLAGWSEVAVLPGSVPRHSLAGSGCGTGRTRIVWTEGSAAPYTLMGADITGLLF